MKKINLFLLLSVCVLQAFSQFNAKLPVVVAPKFKKDTVSIVKFGAVPDGYTLNTRAINNAVDACTKDVVTAALEGGFNIMIIADHGNADNAVNEDGSENTAHSLNPVPCIFISDKKGIQIENGILADVAPTLLNVMGLEVPAEMTGKNLIK